MGTTLLAAGTGRRDRSPRAALEAFVLRDRDRLSNPFRPVDRRAAAPLYSRSLRPAILLTYGADTDGTADVQSAQPEAEEQAWLSRAHGDEGRAPRSEPSPASRAEAPGRVGRPEAVDRTAVAAPLPDGGRRLPRARRITRSADIRAIMTRGKRSGTANLDVFDSASPSSHPRIGLVVPKYRQTAVARNRVKRRLRELLRLEVLPRLEQCGALLDVLVRARRGAYGATYAQLRDELTGWTERRCLRVSSSS
jgi:ribonuclease P protein component